MDKINNKNWTKGVTLVVLSIMIIVLLILASISIHTGKEIIQEAKLEELRTNMLLIQAKAREYVEEANFQIGIFSEGVSEDEKKTKRNSVREKIYENREMLEKAATVPGNLGVSDTDSCYYLTTYTKEKWGLEKIEDEENYIIKFDEENVSVEIYNTQGYDGKYSLSEIDQIEK